MSQGEPDLVRCSAARSTGAGQFGTGAICSLLERCKQVRTLRLSLKGMFDRFSFFFSQVVTDYVSDEKTSGGVPLPRQRAAEMVSVLQAVVTLMDSLQKHSSRAHNQPRQFVATT